MSFLEFLAKIPARPLTGPFSEPITMLRACDAWSSEVGLASAQSGGKMEGNGLTKL